MLAFTSFGTSRRCTLMSMINTATMRVLLTCPTNLIYNIVIIFIIVKEFTISYDLHMRDTVHPWDTYI